jgi:hypothetical protein
MPLEITLVSGRDTERQAIGRLGKRIGGDAAELNGSNFNAPSADFDRVHFELQIKSRLVGGFVSSKR